MFQCRGGVCQETRFSVISGRVRPQRRYFQGETCRRFSEVFFLLLSDFDDFCGCLVILLAFGEVVAAACEFEEECFIGNIFE